ncbi:MAG: rhomboid family intramembrane serine protease [Acidimicrobiia bacterium]|nr:rhomboid family intramembrane serine protease [Acidimicrobiia bacterium]
MGGMNDGTSGAPGPATCYRHRDRITHLRCSRCGRHICAECSRDSPVGQRCPECAGVTTRVVPARSIRSGITPAVLVIILISVAAYLAQRVNAQFTIDYAHITPAVSAGEWWRVITATFLHSTGSIVHILFNMYALYLFGPYIERQAGTGRFVALYLASAVVGGVAFQYMAEGAAVGASGAIFGLFGAVLVGTYPLRHTPAGAARFRQLLLLLAINLALPLLVRGIAWEAHVGGLVAGMLIVLAWQRIPPGPNADLVRTLVPSALLLVGVLAVFVA